MRWTRAAVLRRLDGRTMRVDGRVVKLDAATLTCQGVGGARRRRGVPPAWSRFRCVQPTLPRGAVAGPDLVFTVRPNGRRTFAVLQRHLTRY